MSVRRLKSGVYRLLVPLYEFYVHVAFDAAAVEKEFDGFPATEEARGLDGVVWRLENQERGYNALVALVPADGAPGTVAHESLHLAWRILDWVGVEVDTDNHEALAYLVGWAAKTITELQERERGS